MRTGSEQIFGEIKRRNCLVALHSRKVVEELIQRIPGGQVVERLLAPGEGSRQDQIDVGSTGRSLNGGRAAGSPVTRPACAYATPVSV